MKCCPIIFLLFVLPVFSGCNLESSTTGTLEVDILTVVGDEPAIQQEVYYLIAAGHRFNIKQLKYFLNNIRLIDEHGEAVELMLSHLVDISQEYSLSLKFVELPPGRYTNLSFSVGLPKSQNYEGYLEDTERNDQMAWPVNQYGQGGYSYLKLDGQYDSLQTGHLKTFEFHLGPSYGEDYSVPFDLPIEVDIDGNTVQLALTMDVNQWLEEPTVWDFDHWPTGIESKPEAQQIAKENGADAFSVRVKN